MKHSKKSKLLALVLVLCLSMTTVTPASAAGFSFGRSSSFSWSTILERLFGGSAQTPSTPEAPSEPETGSDTSTESGSTGASGGTMTLVEDETTVSEGTALRATTYTLTNTAGSSSTYAATGDATIAGKTIKYFPVTLYNYDNSYNAALHQMECEAAENLDNLTRWSGIYFGGNDHGAKVDNSESYTYTTSGEVSYTETTVSYSYYGDYSSYINNGYYVDVSGTKYLVTNLSCSYSWRNGYSWTITYAGGTATSSESRITLYKANAGSSETITLSYANWNRWTGNFDVDGQEKHGNKTYSGLVESNLNNGSIQFTQTEAGIFTNDTTNKDVYTNVQMPFVYDDSTKTYTFDANEDGVYFHTDSTQGTSATPASNSKLYFTDTAQSHDFSAQDNRTNGWFPFNDASRVTTASSQSHSADYFFGMQASIPFTMTGNGRLKDNDSTSAPITFSFSGDDDVWVFIDGKLVLDLGGVHNGMNATLNFADNTWNVSEMLTSINGTDRPAEDVNNAELSGKIFNEGKTIGALNQTRETFAATDSHTLTIFYLERGAGSSNCKIQFNLPMKDTVTVTKQITESKTVNEDGEETKQTLSDKEQAAVDAIDFGFTLYKGVTDEEGNVTYEAVANRNYNLLNVNGQVISTPSTDSNGHFTLRNGQTAKFVGAFDEETDTYYYVVEDSRAGFLTPEYSYKAEVANGSRQEAAADGNTSMKVAVQGSDEAEDSLSFTCVNYLDEKLENPGVLPAEDKIVIDYGLPVEIDALANDVYRGDTIELTEVTGAKYGTATIKNGKITYQLTKQLTGVEVLAYTAEVTTTYTKNEVTGETETKTTSDTGTIYIIPATSMYYEEDFYGLVKYNNGKSGAGWKDVGESQTVPQEPGAVGTVDDSPYGSDVAYLNDSTDSNGSSKYVDTTAGAAAFTYTFTGTGTTFFARTTADSGYIKVVITDGDAVNITRFVDTKYVATEDTNVGGTLYNIPVFTSGDLGYGTYTVTVSIAKKSATCGKDFWLDGVRVINPLDLDSDDTNAVIAKAAYASDGEANMTVVTLREKLLEDYAEDSKTGELVWIGEGFVLFTDSNGEIRTASEYKNEGPKEEVYLNNDQSVTFSLKYWDANSNKVYLGIKVPVGSGSVSINDNALSLRNATDCYYDISSYAAITESNGVKIATFKVESTSSLVSVTNIKVTGDTEFIIVGQDDIDVDG